MIPFLSTIAEHYIIVLFLFLNLVIGFWAHSKSKANSFEDYALASRSLPTGVLVMTLLGTALDSGYLAWPNYAFYPYGLVHGIGVIFSVSGFLLIGTFVAPYLVYFDNFLTLGDLMDKMYGRTARFLTGIMSCIICLLVISSQLQAIAAISKKLLGISPSLAVVCFGGVVVLYSMTGGMRSVSYTDVLQIIAIIMTLTLIMNTISQKVGGIKYIFQALPMEKMLVASHPDFYYKIKSGLFWFGPVWLLSPPIIQRMLITQDKRQVRNMWYTGAFLCGIVVFIFTLIGLGAIVGRTQFKLGEDNKFIPDLLLELIIALFGSKRWLIDCLFLGLLAVSISTMDSYLHYVGISLVQDFLEPIKKFWNLAILERKRKSYYAKWTVCLIGIISVLLSVTNYSLENKGFVIPVILMYSMIIIPLLIGIIGIKTDKASWLSFCIAYLLSLKGASWLEWHVYDSFLVAIPLGIISYFLTHIYLNGGIVILKRSEQTIAEQLWIPTWRGTSEYVKSWLLAPFNLHILASRKIVNNPTHSLSFSMLIFALYTFSSVMAGGSDDVGFANFMTGVHLVGITLCVGLMLEGIWPDRLKPYFALYWFCTLFYCLSFGSTLAFLREHGNMMAVIKWIVNVIFLLVLVDSMSFIALTCLGSGLAMGVWYAVFRTIPSDLLGSIGLPGIYFLAGLLVAVLLFASSREKHVNQRFDWNRTASSALGHDLRLTVSMLEGAGRTLGNAFKVSESMTNTKGEKGCWVPQGQATFLESFSEKMIERGAMAGKEIQDFSDFIKSQVIGIFEQKKTGMRAAAEEAIHKLKDKMPPTVKMKVSGEKDFSPKVLSGVFTNVFYNLLWNAATHGKASKMEIRIDGVKRTVAVWDNGRGIPSDVLPRIFDLNFSTGMKRTKNSGVGLAFVKMVIAASSGKISCHSRHGDKGSFTAFVMEFPEV